MTDKQPDNKKKKRSAKQIEASKETLRNGKYSFARDLSLLKSLASGATDLKDIRVQMHKLYKIPMSQRAIEEKMRKFIKKGIVESGSYPNKLNMNGKYSLYALTEDGKTYLASNNYLRGHIRSNLPGKHIVSHDVQIRETVRAIKREAGRVKNYNYSILDELELRQLSKRSYYPDLMLTLQIDVESDSIFFQFYMEIDNDTESIEYIVLKTKGIIEQEEKPVIIVCTHYKRIESITKRLSQEIAKELKKQAHAPNAPHKEYWPLIKLIVFYDFATNGFLQSTFYKAGGEKTTFLGPKHQGKIKIGTLDVPD